MKTIDQCPSTKGKQDIPAEAPDLVRSNGKPTGRAYWRSVDEFGKSPEFKDWMEREFPPGASELAFSATESTRRDFMKIMAAGFALAGAATIPGCRRPDHKIFAYSANEPEHLIPGKPLYYATSMPLPGGGAEGLLVETHGARPTKIEGNPLHPINRGKSSIWSQSEILRLYDPDRLKECLYRGDESAGEQLATWDDFGIWWSQRVEDKYASNGGRGLAIICDRMASPTLEAMRTRLLQRFPSATWTWWSPTHRNLSEIKGTGITLGGPKIAMHTLDNTRCILSLDRDFTTEGPSSIKDARAWAATREVNTANEEMSRLYVAEPQPTATGSAADHRFAMSPTRISALAVEVAKRIFALRPVADLATQLAAIEVPDADADDVRHAEAIAVDLLAHAETNPGSALVMVGANQPVGVHALAVAMNRALGAEGRSVRYRDALEIERANPIEQLSELASAIDAGSIDTVVTIGTNPAFDAPGAMNFAEKLASVEATVAWSVDQSETAAGATWQLNGAHFLESWGDTIADDGTIAPTQPMIAPLYEPAKSDIEFLAMLAGEETTDGLSLVRASWANRLGVRETSDGFTKAWRRSLHDGVSPINIANYANARFNAGAVAAACRQLALGAPASDAMHVVFTPSRIGEGRYANCGWLQELPQLGTMVCWDNPLVVSPKTAEDLGLLPRGLGNTEGNMDGVYTSGQMPKARMATISVNGRTMEAPVWILPGMPDNVIQVQLGYGRTNAGLVADGVGFDTFEIFPSEPIAEGMPVGVLTDATLARADGTYGIASTQNHWSMESRTSIVRAIDKQYFDAHAPESIDYKPKSKPDKIYGTNLAEGGLNIAEQLGELSHTPENVSIYENPLNESRVDPAPGAAYSKGPQWGMTIDLNRCTGCGLCTVACQAENNIPIVGKTEVAKGREMTWIRVDRYFSGDDLNNPDECLHQPVACVHCENAPCETVCPVNATVHGPEGTNNMAYNRCIGTRYCANNCPYKVRRFNFFDYGQTKYNGSFIGEDLVGGEDGKLNQQTFNKNFIPPRLREKLDEITAMRKNPDVTVRGRGVMEKCTYCIQRINAARQEVKVRGMWTSDDQVAPIPEGFFQVACEQACPTEAITFGDILNPDAKVTELRDSPRSYMLLGYLNTRPRTSYLLRVRNPNPSVRVFDDTDPLYHGYGGDDHSDDHGGEYPEDQSSEEARATPAFFEPFKKTADTGYAMSLRLL